MSARIEQVIAAALRELIGEDVCIQEITLAPGPTVAHQKYAVGYVEAGGKRGTMELEVADSDLLSMEPV